MPRKFLIPLVAVGAFLILIVGGAFAYDSATSQTIAPGVEVGSVDVGGLTADEARVKLHRELRASVEEPLVVQRGKRSWKLGPEQSKASVDIDGSVGEALATSNSGNFLVRAYRKVTGSEMSATVAPEITYSKPAVAKMVKRVTKAVDRPAKDASLSITANAVAPVAAKRGVKVRRVRLLRSLSTALTTPGARHTVPLVVQSLQPKVTTGQLASKYPTLITVDRTNFKLTLFKDLKPVKTYIVAVGQAGLETPAGLYSIQDMQVNPSWHVPNSAWAGDLAGQVIPPGPNNPIKARWMGIADSAGIHGTADPGSLGSAASHGCVRMDIPDVIDLYDQVSVGTPVFIA